MPTPIKIKNSQTADAAPTTGDLVAAELALNLADGQLYYRDHNSNIRKLTGKTDTSGNVTYEGDVTYGGDVVYSSSPVIRPTIITDATTARTITATDENAVILFTSSSAVSVTLPLDSTEDLADGFIVHIHQDGTGQVTIAGEGGVTVKVSDSAVTRAQYSSLSVIKTGADEFKVIGDQA